MGSVDRFELFLVLVAVIVALDVLARRLRLPPAAAMIAGGAALTFLPGMPELRIDPDLVLTLFLPPLLMASAYFIVWREFRANLASILLLAVGAVGFTTLCVGVAVHLVLPSVPWPACFALGAVVSPPDAVAAKAMLVGVRLPRRTIALLEGESLLNDAAGIVLFRFAVAAALSGGFSLAGATLDFVGLAAGGILVGAVVGFGVLPIFRRSRHNPSGITLSLLMPYAAYIGAERIGASGVIATVVAGLVLGWYQHEVFDADGRRTGGAVWTVLTYLFEAMVFVLIGMSLRRVIEAFGGLGATFERFGLPVLAVIAAVILSRFVWILVSDRIRATFRRFRGPEPAAPMGPAIVMSWAGMRGVVTLAIALSVPSGMPGRDVILVSAFAVILVTVLLQGTTLRRLIRALSIDASGEPNAYLGPMEAMREISAAQLVVVDRLARDEAGTVIHPRLLEQYTYRAELMGRLDTIEDETRLRLRNAHFGVVLAAVEAGRKAVLRLHRTGRIHDETLHRLEQDLDLQEVAAQRIIDPGRS